MVSKKNKKTGLIFASCIAYTSDSYKPNINKKAFCFQKAFKTQCQKKNYFTIFISTLRFCCIPFTSGLPLGKVLGAIGAVLP